MSPCCAAARTGGALGALGRARDRVEAVDLDPVLVSLSFYRDHLLEPANFLDL